MKGEEGGSRCDSTTNSLQCPLPLPIRRNEQYTLDYLSGGTHMPARRIRVSFIYGESEGGF